MKKILLTSLLFLGLSVSGFAQSDKMKETATEKVEQLNEEIIAGDKSIALSTDQKTKIYNIHVERLEALRAAKKEGANDETNKAINKKYFQKIYKEVLTKEQLKARKKGKETEE